ncbi:caspase domain-containing protein [Dichomitus squalens]|uniref:Caspase domain-containing protein n=1 Tax=Dichomitus squalens TaxID=114155 RepID=A0A4Q9MEE4_9APHY|nr:caspase domain-containing protein [Dichomitus squalens]
MPTATNQEPEGDKKALLVGIGYETNENGFQVQDSTRKDVENMKELLMSTYHYAEKDIVIMTDSDTVSHESKYWPTRANIIKAMNTLVQGRRPGDRIVFAFSGHGDQVEVDVDKNEDDGKDEILIPIDCKVVWEKGAPVYSNFIRDDEIREILVDKIKDLEGLHCTMVFDCCHSGTASDLDNVEVLSPISPPGSQTTGGFDEQQTFGRKTGGIFIEVSSGHEYTNKDLMRALRYTSNNVSVARANKRLKKHEGQVDSMDYFDTPRPQLGSLTKPEDILHDRFML